MDEVRVFPSAPADSAPAALAAELRRTCADKGFSPYLLVDASRSPATRFVIETMTDHALCLFDGEAFDDLAEVAPWLVPLTLDARDDVYDWFMAEGYGNDWGVFVLAGAEARKVKTTLKRSLKVVDEDGNELYFKYYRPSVFNTYLPAMEPDQASFILRGIEQVWAEDPDDPARLRRYAIREGTLRRADLGLTVEGET
ncbi:DUF4123 domain-containing protein [Thetidibacter halocola]|uniref:DUF4123 domain-containing protein n=1 Tax=Thetidibacter halocola TaxID=2827239 RepID=A0A8J7WEB1_9RHOB|nr:DUF4123 domain-containing protein [Thetidibacter halocola]MBS0123538.1 DUF4123 domain-containing protein [Thetidibacter halocola]